MATTTQPDLTDRYLEADGVTAKVVNPVVAWLTRRGLSLAGSRVLEVRGRTSGEWRSTPVNPLRVHGAEYLVAPRGHTHWVRNMRVAGGGRLRKGRRVETFTAVELDDAEKPEILRAYLAKWKWEVGAFFDGIDADATEEQLVAVAAGYPVFRITWV
jgi:deazaflavin-dependent oxidoreductase (nitroreductase family)